MKRLFFGGIHPKYNKEMSTHITDFVEIKPKQVVIPMQQHIGAPCKALVKRGDQVTMGQKIGEIGVFLQKLFFGKIGHEF